MRLLQLATGPHELVDLHPNVTVVTGLDGEGRRLLNAAVNGLAKGEASGARGLLEAHGVLFDLTPEMVGLLEVTVDDLRPVVGSVDLPTGRLDPAARQRAEAERKLAEAEARWATAEQVDWQARRAMAAAVEAVQRARQAVAAAETDAAGRIGPVDLLTAELDRAVEERRRLAQVRAELDPRVTQATDARAEVEAATAERRDARREAEARCALLAAQVEQAAASLDPDAGRVAYEAAAALAEVEGEVAAERPAARRAARERAAAVDRDALVPSPRALALADALVALDAQLVTASDVRGRPEGLAEGRDRLEGARQAHLEAEQSVRSPGLDRAAVDRLEVAHAELLEAIEKADGRFGGARAQRRVEAGRAAEQVVLDELGFTSYSDYMMGYSLQHVDPEKEAALEAARSNLSAAEDHWKALQAMTDVELVQAELMERRRVLVEEARRHLPRPVPVGSLIDELRALRVPVAVAPADSLAAFSEPIPPEGGRAVRLAEATRSAHQADQRRRAHEEAERTMRSLTDELAVATEEERRAVAAALDAEEAVAGAAGRADGLLDELRRLDQQLTQARQEEAASEERVRTSSNAVGAPPIAALIAATAQAEAVAASTEEAAERAAQALQAAEVQRQEATSAGEALRRAPGAIDEDVSAAEEIEWYLLARLAAQRSVSLAGSLPLVIDDALGGLDEGALGSVLDRLERMSEAVQVIVVTDDLRSLAWAQLAGPDRAAVVSPQPI